MEPVGMSLIDVQEWSMGGCTRPEWCGGPFPKPSPIGEAQPTLNMCKACAVTRLRTPRKVPAHTGPIHGKRLEWIICDDVLTDPPAPKDLHAVMRWWNKMKGPGK